MPGVLVSGMAAQVAAVAAALRERGATVTEVPDLDDVPAVAAAAGAGAFDSYVQLPATFAIEGDTAVLRVHNFFADGVLARFPALAGRPARPDPARGGSRSSSGSCRSRSPPPTTGRRGRHSSGCCRTRPAPTPAATWRCGSWTPAPSPDEIALVALGRDPTREAVLEHLADMNYEDLRVELLGLVSVET